MLAIIIPYEVERDFLHEKYMFKRRELKFCEIYII